MFLHSLSFVCLKIVFFFFWPIVRHFSVNFERYLYERCNTNKVVYHCYCYHHIIIAVYGKVDLLYCYRKCQTFLIELVLVLNKHSHSLPKVYRLYSLNNNNKMTNVPQLQHVSLATSSRIRMIFGLNGHAGPAEHTVGHMTALWVMYLQYYHKLWLHLVIDKTLSLPMEDPGVALISAVDVVLRQ